MTTGTRRLLDRVPVETDQHDAWEASMSFRIIQQGSVALVDGMSKTDQNWWLRALVLGDSYGSIKLSDWGAPKASIEKLEAAGHIVTDGDWAWIARFDLTQTRKSLKGRPERCSPDPPLQLRDLMTMPADEVSALLSLCVPEVGPEDVVAPEATKDTEPVDDVQAVFDHWAAKEAETGGIKGAKLTAGRRSRITQRLNEGYTVDQLKACVDGYLADSFYLGKDKGKPKRYTTIDTIFLNGERVERGSAMSEMSTSSDDRFAAYDKVGT